MRVDYLGLEAFVAVAELGSFSRAAQRLNLTQTALSHRIRKIEEDLGTRLLVRTSREVSLTMAGQALLPQVRGRLETLAELYGTVRNSGREAMRKVVFASVPTIAGYYLAGLMQTFSEANQGLSVILLDQPAAAVVSTVQRGEAEFGITITGATPWDIESEYLCTEPYVLLVNRKHRLAGRKSVRREDLLGEPLVRIRTQSTNRQLIEDSLGSVSRELDWRFEVQNAATAMNLVAAGTAITVLPRLTMYQAPHQLVGLSFDDVDLTRAVVAVTRRAVPLSDAAESLLAMIRKRLSEVDDAHA
ncbi:LysR family transcriptional regulator [Pelagibacterium flavum]|uniref:LysR family transcriptional regulator n=1 Tax=Pelagibacterium flavum TaxID=2984530 RepID=A0ABY6IN20_9HYPH|nr:LysR family transcriptional regulator [Pelagibacterium sp. YIM 151497]UYQ72003.1 LysR family transcriptional regulator [Pelagibacterium sp. YIM 151497]